MPAELLPLTPDNFPPGAWVLGKFKIHRVDSWPTTEVVQVQSWATTDPSLIDRDHPDGGPGASDAKYNVEAKGSYEKIPDSKIGKLAEEPEPIAVHTPNPRDLVLSVLSDVGGVSNARAISSIAVETGLAEAVVLAFVETLVGEAILEHQDDQVWKITHGADPFEEPAPVALEQPASSGPTVASGGIVVEGTAERLDEAVVKGRLAADHERFALTGSSLPLPDIRVCSEGGDEKQAYDLIRYAQDILLLASYAIRDRHLRRDCLDTALTAGYLIDSEVSA